jgi:TonB family protein
VVDLPPSADDRPPPQDSAFLAEHNARAQKQTRSRHAAPDHPNVMNEPSVAQQDPRQAAKTPASGRDGDDATGARRRPPRLGVPQRMPQEHRDRLQLRQDAAGTARNQQAQQASPPGPVQLRLGPQAPPGDADAQGAARGRGGAPLGAPLTMAQLIPSVGTLAQLQGGPKNDVGPDIEEGDGTFLNAREFRYAGFFNRLKEQIAHYWRPMPEYARRDPTGNIYGLQNRLTVLTVALTEEGALHDVQVLQSSGIAFLDDAGVDAIRAAAPFMHPPRGLLNADKRIVFNFAFSVDVTGRYSGPP